MPKLTVGKQGGSEMAGKLDEAKALFESGELDGRSTHEVADRLKELGLTKSEIHNFGDWFIRKGLDEGWLVTELGY